jgi:hypothetical protein
MNKTDLIQKVKALDGLSQDESKHQKEIWLGVGREA